MTAQAVVGVAAFLRPDDGLADAESVSQEESPREMDRDELNGVDPVYVVLGGTTVVLLVVMVLLLF
jgi:hypothetical protein